MKKILVAISIITLNAFGWEVNTHRAIDRQAIEKSSNLDSFIENSQIENVFENSAIQFDSYGMNYIEYILNGEENAISKWNQKFTYDQNKTKNATIHDLLEAGSILEDAQWADHPWFGANGRFLNHFADPQNGYKGFSLGEANALSWATTEGRVQSVEGRGV